ncbi:type II CAAX prenyl endopeptidase Rce1 family protein [uncultured Hymenobacter sp.]|uniref:CPBP family glutamic-type intramembrane protease n=1 Tax=uncultured Hymenobacter sp. TaxID=170016 RepID=UPI0035CBCCFC
MIVLFLGLLCLLLCVPRLRTAPRAIGLAALVYALSELATMLPVWLGPQFNFGLQRNWTGKALSVLLSLLVIYGFKWVSPAEVGLNRPRPGSWRAGGPVVLGFAVLQMLSTALGPLRPAPSVEAYLYQLTMPGIAEELLYRGTFLGLLSQAFPRTISFFGTRTSWGGLVGVGLFLLAHGLVFDGPLTLLPQAHFPLGRILDKLLFGTLFLWVRERSGSCLVAMAAHNLMNVGLLLGTSLS